MFMNEHDIEEAVRRFGHGDTPNLHAGALALQRLCDWTNRNSDGWPYWQLPGRAAQKLQTLLSAADRFDPQDCTDAELRKALTPIKAFLTRRGADHAEVFPPPPPPAPDPIATVIEVKVNDQWIKLNDRESMVVFRVNGHDVCAIDQFYVHRDIDPGDEPFDPYEPDMPPHVIVGHWGIQKPGEDPDDWQRDAVYVIPDTKETHG